MQHVRFPILPPHGTRTQSIKTTNILLCRLRCCTASHTYANYHLYNRIGNDNTNEAHSFIYHPTSSRKNISKLFQVNCLRISFIHFYSNRVLLTFDCRPISGRQTLSNWLYQWAAIFRRKCRARTRGRGKEIAINQGRSVHILERPPSGRRYIQRDTILCVRMDTHLLQNK